MMQSGGFNINDLVQEAQNRWLKPAEVLFILQNHENYQITEGPPQKPKSGSLLLFNKRVTRFFRKDGHIWRKKKAGRTVREGHERLKVGNAEALNCYYAHGEQNSNFQRRSFWMLDPVYEHIVLVHYREIVEGKHSAGSVHLSPENRVSISGISEPNHGSPFSLGSIDFNSELPVRSNGVSHMGEPGRTVELSSSPATNVNQALERLEEQSNLNGDKLPERSSYFEENERLEDTWFQNYGRISDQDELVALQYTADYGKNREFSGGNAGCSNDSKHSGYATESKEVLSWNVLPEQCPPSWWIGSQDNVFSTLDEIEKPLSFSEREDISGNLAERQGGWNFQGLNSSWPGNDTEYMSNCHPTVLNNFEPQLSEARQFLLDPDNILSPTATSLLEEIEYSKVSVHSSGTSTHEAISNGYFDQINELEVSLGADSRLTPAQKQRFRIREISPEWGYETEYTKVIIAGSFLCDPSECTWSCMFGEIEVPIQIIQEGVLSCQAPPHIPGKVTLCITSSNHESCSEVREFKYCSKSSICDNCSSCQRDTNEHKPDLLLLVRLVQMLLCDPLVLKEDSVQSTMNKFGIPKVDEDRWQHIIEALFVGTETQVDTKDWLLQELLKDKLQNWLLSKYNEGSPSGFSLTKKEQGIIHLMAGLGFEWALKPTLKCGVCVNYRDINGWTALHWAARFGREKMVAALVAAGASAGVVTDPTSQDPIGKTPGSIASDNGHKGLAGYLSELALTSHLSSLKLEESEIPKEPVAVEVERSVESISKGSFNSTDDQLSLKDSLDAVRNSAQAASRIQSFFRIYSYKRRQQREAAAACCNEYGITPDELAAASSLAFSRFHDHMLDKAALSIQKKYREWKGRQKLLDLRQKIVMIQAHVRGYQVRKKYKVILWAVGVLDKVVLRWYRKRVGLRGFQPDLASVDESEYEDILKVFRKLKVDQTVDAALSRVLSMVESPEARQQYRRMLESYWQAKTDLLDSANEAASISQDNGDN